MLCRIPVTAGSRGQLRRVELVFDTVVHEVLYLIPYMHYIDMAGNASGSGRGSLE
jgi:hypothetical protein